MFQNPPSCRNFFNYIFSADIGAIRHVLSYNSGKTHSKKKNTFRRLHSDTGKIHGVYNRCSQFQLMIISHSAPPELSPEAELTFLCHSDLYLDPIFEVAVNRDTTLTHNMSCHFTLLPNQQVNCLCLKQRWKGQEKWDYYLWKSP